MTLPERRLSTRAFLIDAGAVALVSLLVCLFSQRLTLMTVLVPLVLAARLVLFLLVPRSERDIDGRAEVALVTLTTLAGAFNDWNSVTRHRIYDYNVPTDLPGLSHIPIWMLLYWGLILRFVLSVFHWQGAQRVRTSWSRALLLLALVFATRQLIYRYFADPLWSWLPFALALALVAALHRKDRLRLRLLGVTLLVGPAVEALYIGVGRLHAYHLGWLGGVPLWIALWWGLAALVWEELGTRLMDLLERALSRSADAPPASPAPRARPDAPSDRSGAGPAASSGTRPA